MAEWKITDKSLDWVNTFAPIVGQIQTGINGPSYKYEVENEDTGETKIIRAHDEDEVGKIIASGLDDEDD